MKRLCICSILLFSAATMYAADLKDFSIYGSVRMGTWLDKTDKFLDDLYSQWDTTQSGSDTRPDYHFNIIPYGKLGISYKTAGIGVTFELWAQTAISNSYFGGITGMLFYKSEKYYAAIYRFFAEWYLNDRVTFLVGQDYVPICFFSSNQMFYDNNSFGNTGSLWGGRKPMLEIIFSNLKDSPNFGLEAKLAAIRVDTCTVRYDQDPVPLTNSKFPKFEASFNGQLNNDPFKADLKVAGGFQQYYLARSIGAVGYIPDSQKVQTIDCYVAGAHIGVNFSSLSLKMDYAFGQNFGAYGLYIGNPFVYRGFSKSYLSDIFYPSIDVDSTGFVNNNNKTQEADGIVGFKASPWLSFEAGIGWVHAENGDSTISANWHDVIAGYVQAEITAKEVITFTPEIGIYSYGPKIGYGRMMYAGFGTRVDF